MIRTFNYTGRKPIPKEHVQIRLSRTAAEMNFDALLEFKDLRFPESARVFVEAYHQSVYMRFDFGTVGSPKVPAPEERRLVSFYNGSPVNFRVKIVDESGADGKILGVADAIRPQRDDDLSRKNPLIPVRIVGGMGQEIWRVVWDAKGPIVELNQELPGIKERIIKESRFRSLIMPEVLRTVLAQIVSSSLDENEDYTEAAENWFKFAANFYPEKPPIDDRSITKIQEWVQAVVKSFCEKHQFFAHWKDAVIPSEDIAS